ncbi:ROK family protein [Belliella marina]|uniref:ROK family protein n=1 Tax=Belliella marina TaxID=1644146 RepID=A0ABW4VU29_9BACT
MKFDRPILGLDIGGTNIKGGILIGEKLLDIRSIPTPANESQEVVLETIAKFIATYKHHGIGAIGIGIPGLVDVENGIVLNLYNIPSFRKVGLKKYLENWFNIPVCINNDANCFILGEHRFGTARDFKHLVGITLGTGLGSGIIVNNHLYNGVNSAAGEWCSVKYLDKTFEFYCGSKFFISEYGKKPKSLAKLAENGDEMALEAFVQYGKHLGELVKNILYTLAPEAIVLGGSIRKAYPYFKDSMYETIDTFLYPSVKENLKIIISDLDETGICGAVALVEEYMEY